MSPDDPRATALLAGVADQAPAGPPPLADLRRRIRRDRAVRGAAATAVLAGLVAVAAVAAVAMVPTALLLGQDEATGPERLVATLPPPAGPTSAAPAPSPSLRDLRPTGPVPDLVVEGGPVDEVYLDSIGDARTDPLDPSLLVVSIPAGQGGSGPQDAGTPCWSGATARATADGGVVRLEPVQLLNARPPVRPSLPPGSAYGCDLSLGFTQVLVQLPGALDGRPVRLPDGRTLEVADGGLLPVATELPERWVFRRAGATMVRYESALDRTVAADLHTGAQPDPDGLQLVDRFDAGGAEALVRLYGPLGFRVAWSDAAGRLWADVAGLQLPEVRALVRSVVRAGEAYG